MPLGVCLENNFAVARRRETASEEALWCCAGFPQQALALLKDMALCLNNEKHLLSIPRCHDLDFVDPPIENRC